MSDERTIKPNAPADFTPQLGDYKTLQPFRYWCQKVLPLVYDESLSYYELLCKVIDYLNKTMEDIETLNGDVNSLHTAYTKLQSYVNNYFNNLDVQQEINNKLDSMAKDGSLTNLIKAYIDPLINEQNNKITVLENRMNTFASLPEGSTSSDAELTDIRVPANGFNDNKPYTTAGNAVRGQVGSLKKDLDNLADISVNDLLNGITYENKIFGSDSYLDTAMVENNNFLCTPILSITPNKKYRITVPNNVVYCYWSAFSKSVTTGSKFYNWSSDDIIQVEAPYIRICFSYPGYTTAMDASTFKANAYYVNDIKVDTSYMIDITDSNWVLSSENYQTNEKVKLDISQDYYIEIPDRTQCLINLYDAGGNNSGSIGWLSKSQIISFNGVAFDVFKHFTISQRFYGGFETINSDNRPKIYKVGVSNESQTLTFNMTQNGYVNATDGTITNKSDIYWGVTDYLTIPHNTKIILNNMRYNTDIALMLGYAIYDENKKFLRGGRENAIKVKNADRYIVLCDANSEGTHVNRTVCFVGNSSPFADKKIAFSGDSITFGYNDLLSGKQLDNTWVNQVGNALGVKEVINLGVSSATLMKSDNTSIIEVYKEYSDNIDIIGFMIGINDAYHNYPFGKIDSTDETTFCGCMHSLCNGIINKWKPSDDKFVFIMLYPQADATLVNPDAIYKGLHGWEAWIEATKDIAQYYAIPVCDLYHNVGITPHSDTKNIYWGGSPTKHSAHPTQIGANVFAKYIENWMKRTFELT